MAADIRAIFNAPDRAQAEVQLRKTVEKYAQSASKLADWLEGNLPKGLTVFSFPEDHWRRIRTVNSLERVCLEIHRRTRVAGIFPNGASCCRLPCWLCRLGPITGRWKPVPGPHDPVLYLLGDSHTTAECH